MKTSFAAKKIRLIKRAKYAKNFRIIRASGIVAVFDVRPELWKDPNGQSIVKIDNVKFLISTVKSCTFENGVYVVDLVSGASRYRRPESAADIVKDFMGV